MTAPISALKTTLPCSILASARPAATSSWTRARYAAPPSAPIGETPTSSVNIAMLAGSRMPVSGGRTWRTAGSGRTSGSAAIAISG